MHGVKVKNSSEYFLKNLLQYISKVVVHRCFPPPLCSKPDEKSQEDCKCLPINKRPFVPSLIVLVVNLTKCNVEFLVNKWKMQQQAVLVELPWLYTVSISGHSGRSNSDVAAFMTNNCYLVALSCCVKAVTPRSTYLRQRLERLLPGQERDQMKLCFVFWSSLRSALL